MSSHKYRKLLTNLPSMAAVVNSFQSPEVQLEVYKLLVNELGDAVNEPAAASGSSASVRSNASAEGVADTELAHQLVDGDSIHSISADDEDE